jgi:hypothetical protein
VAEERRSGLSDDVDELARKIMGVICDEQPSLGNKLNSAAIHDRLIENGVELPDYAMHEALNRLNGMFRYFLGGPQNPHDPADTETVRRHGGITIVGVVDPDLCDEF